MLIYMKRSKNSILLVNLVFFYFLHFIVFNDFFRLNNLSLLKLTPGKVCFWSDVRTGEKEEAFFKYQATFISATESKSGSNKLRLILKKNINFAYDVVSTAVKKNISRESVKSLDKIEKEVSNFFKTKIDFNIIPSISKIKSIKKKLREEKSKRDIHPCRVDEEDDNDDSVLYTVGALVTTDALEDEDNNKYIDEAEESSQEDVVYKIVRRYTQDGEEMLDVRPLMGSDTNKIYSIRAIDANICDNPTRRLIHMWDRWSVPIDGKLMGRYSVENPKHLLSGFLSGLRSLGIGAQMTIVNLINAVYTFSEIQLFDTYDEMIKYKVLRSLFLKKDAEVTSDLLIESSNVDSSIPTNEEDSDDESDEEDEEDLVDLSNTADNLSEEETFYREIVAKRKKKRKRLLKNLKSSIKESVVNLPLSLAVFLNQVLQGSVNTVEAVISSYNGLTWDEQTATWKLFQLNHECSKKGITTDKPFELEAASDFMNKLSTPHTAAYLNLHLDPKKATMAEIDNSYDSSEHDINDEGKEQISDPYKRFIYNVFGTTLDDPNKANNFDYLFSLYFKYLEKFIGTSAVFVDSINNNDFKKINYNSNETSQTKMAFTLRKMLNEYMEEKALTGHVTEWKENLANEIRVLCQSPFYKVLVQSLLTGLKRAKFKLRNSVISKLYDINVCAADVIDSSLISFWNVIQNLKKSKILDYYYSNHKFSSDLSNDELKEENKQYEERMTRGTFKQSIIAKTLKLSSNIKDNVVGAVKLLKTDLTNAGEYNEKKNDMLEMLDDYMLILKTEMDRREAFVGDKARNIFDIDGASPMFRLLDFWSKEDVTSLYVPPDFNKESIFTSAETEEDAYMNI